jgi:hypothetical protein
MVKFFFMVDGQNCNRRASRGKTFHQKRKPAACAFFHKLIGYMSSLLRLRRLRPLKATRPTGYFAAESEVGSVFAMTAVTMNQVSNKTSKPPLRGSSLTRLRQVAAAGSLLDYWTDFGRLLT